jgi:hypothetical protein
MSHAILNTKTDDCRYSLKYNSEAAQSWNTGGTGQAIAQADGWWIPVVNLTEGIAVMQRLAGWVV